MANLLIMQRAMMMTIRYELSIFPVRMKIIATKLFSFLSSKG